MMCADHMKEHGVGVGLGHGQRLWLPHEQHAPGQVPASELPPPPRHAQSACGNCGAAWFSTALGWRDFIPYCPKCVRLLPDRAQGPYTFGDTLEVTYPAGKWAGTYLARVIQIPPVEDEALTTRFFEEDGTADTVQILRDGLGVWWDIDSGISGLTVKLAGEAGVKEWLRRVESWSENFGGAKDPTLKWR
jgi:hypothetical protein